MASILSFNETVDLTIGWYQDYYNLIFHIILLSPTFEAYRPSMSNNPSDIKARILELTAEYSRLVHTNNSPEGNSSWQSGESILMRRESFSRKS